MISSDENIICKNLKEGIEEMLTGLIQDRRRMLVWSLENVRKKESAIHLVKVPDDSVLQVTNNLKTPPNHTVTGRSSAAVK